MSENQLVQLRVADGVAHLQLNRPDERNSMNLDMMQELFAAAVSCDEDRSVRAILITGVGSTFCAGGDLAYFGNRLNNISSLIKEMTLYLHGAVSRLRQTRAPIIVAVQGAAAGGGMSLALSGDLVIAGATAMFVSAYTAAGLTPDGSSTWFVPRLVGLRRAQELMLTNRRLSAAEALEWGLITRVVPDDELIATGEALAAEIAAGPTEAFAQVKKLLQASENAGLEEQMALEATTFANTVRGSDASNGIRAFLEKRAPVFTGDCE